jgi:hypothetical protein
MGINNTIFSTKEKEQIKMRYWKIAHLLVFPQPKM